MKENCSCGAVWESHIFKSMSNFQGAVTFSRVSYIFMCMSNFQGAVTFSRVCQIFKGMSHEVTFQG